MTFHAMACMLFNFATIRPPPPPISRARVQGRRCDWLLHVLVTFCAVRYQRKALVAVHRAYQQGGNAVVRGLGAVGQGTAGTSTPAAAAAGGAAAVTSGVVATLESAREAAGEAMGNAQKLLLQLRGAPPSVEISALVSMTAFLEKVNPCLPQCARTPR